MPQKIQLDKFTRREIPLEPFHLFESTSDDNQKTIAHLLAWDETEKMWRLVRCDASGLLKVSGVSPPTDYEYKSVSVSDTETTVSLTQTRGTHLIINDGTNECFIAFDKTATTSSFPLYAGETLSIDLEFKTLHAICNSGETTTLRWLALG